MKEKFIVTSLSLMLAATSAQAIRSDISVNNMYEPVLPSHQSVPLDRLYLAGKTKDVQKTTTKTKRDGTVVTKEVRKTNDGKGNKETTRTTTTESSDGSSSGSGGGSGGASYEGY